MAYDFESSDHTRTDHPFTGHLPSRMNGGGSDSILLTIIDVEIDMTTRPRMGHIAGKKASSVYP
mgnify:FL=1